MNIPEFIIYTGPMFGSKTTRLLATVDRYRYQNKKVAAFKPKLDDRYSVGKITTHNGGSIDAHIVVNGDDILNFVKCADQEFDVIAVDEAFMIDSVAAALVDLFKRGMTIVVSSLELSASCLAFENVQEIFPWATKIQKCPAVCMVCGRDAYYTHRKIDSLDEITIGGSDLYEPRCWYHHSSMNLKEETDLDGA